MPGAGLGIIWLDGRALELDKKSGSDNMSVRAAFFDRAGGQVSESLVDDRACDCCPTAVAITDDGPVAAYRDRSAGEVRDIANLLAIHDGRKLDLRALDGKIRAAQRQYIPGD